MARLTDTELTVDLPTAIQLAERNAPELLGPQAEVAGVSGFRDASRRTLHRPPRLEMSVGPRHVSGGARLGIDATLGVFQEFSTGGYGTELERYTASLGQRAQTHRDAIRRDARVRASIAWLDALEARELLALRARAREGAKELLRIAEARVQSGRSSPGEAALAQSLVGNAEAAVLSAEGLITVADATLRHVCGIELHQPMKISGVLEAPPHSIDESALRNHVREVAPDLLAARADAANAEQSVKLGRAHSKPHLEVGPSVTHEGTGDWMFLGHLRLPLPGIDPAAADNAERQFTAKVARATAQIVEQAVLRDVEIALHEREHAIRVRDLLKSASITPADRAAHEAQLQYEAGRTDLVSVITARRELFDALERWTRAAVDVRRAEARLERYIAIDLHMRGQKAAQPR